MAVFWFLAASMAGVASDFVRIPYPKKVVTSFAALVISVLLTVVAAKTKRIWPAPAFFGLASLLCFVMWFWN